MRKIFFLLIFLFFLPFAYAQEIPQPVGWVNDFAGAISSEGKNKLNSLIEEVEQKTSAEIAVVIVDSISPYTEVEYARKLFDNWKPGKKGKDNGVLVLLAIKERRWRIETGYGIEGILPDGLCGEIGRNYMVPYFKEGNYSEGLYQGVVKISGIISGTINPDSIAERSSSLKTIGGGFSLLFYILAFVILISPWWVAIAIFLTLIAIAVIFKIYFLITATIIGFVILAAIKSSRRYGTGVTGGFGGGGFGGGGFGGGGFGGGGFGGGGGGGGGAGGGF